MAQRQCDVLVIRGTVVTVDDENTVVHDGALAVVGNRIAAIGPTERLLAEWRAARTVDAAGAIVLPGLINAHTHLAMTLYRGYADDLTLQGFLDRIWERERATISEETVELGVTGGIAESLRCGVTTALDMYYHHAVSLDVAERVGFRLVTGPSLFDFPAPDGTDFDSRYDAAQRWLESSQPSLGLRACVCPHATYTLSHDQLSAVRELADAHDALVHVHASENRREVADVRERHGRTPIELLDDTGLLRPGTVLAHGVVLSDAEMDRIATSGAAVAHCPASNLKLASGIALVPELQSRGVTVALGTDGAASSNDLDMWIAMRLAALLHKARLDNPAVLPAPQVVRMATIEGARALGIDSEVGSLEVGKRADLVLTASDRIAAQPVYDPHGALVYALGRGDVRYVLVDGRFSVEEGRVSALDEAAVARAIAKFALSSEG